ncbi:hypothetical protein CLF_106609, partial [Clonorchis sinensis]
RGGSCYEGLSGAQQLVNQADSCMDAVVCQDPTKRPTRLRYERLPNEAAVGNPSAPNQKHNAVGSLMFAYVVSTDRPRDTGAIVLGPQKRTWNTGCHVSYPTGRDNSDTGFTRAGKVSDYRGKERQLSRNPGDFKHDFRGAGRDRGGLRRNEGQFSRGRFHDRHGGQRPGHFAEEPEWFSEGPTTVTETIELGRVLEDEDGDSSVTFARKLATPPISPTDGGDRETDDVSGHQNTNPNVNQTSTARSPQSQLQDSPQSSPSGETPGSRFRYLFPKPDVNSDKKTSAINDQLLGLLKGASGQSVSSPEKHNGIWIRPESNLNSVLQVENKLRSLLLGHNLPRSTDPFQQKSGQREASTTGNSYATGPKPKILTVEEIEAQLNLSTKPPVSLPMANSQHVEIERPAEQSSTLTQTRTSVPSTSTSNLAPVLHSLAAQQQHQAMCTKQLQLHNPLVPFGILSNPMVRLPSALLVLYKHGLVFRLERSSSNRICPAPLLKLDLVTLQPQQSVESMWISPMRYAAYRTSSLCTNSPSRKSVNWHTEHVDKPAQLRSAISSFIMEELSLPKAIRRNSVLLTQDFHPIRTILHSAVTVCAVTKMGRPVNRSEMADWLEREFTDRKTNAMSASARINQLQHVDSPTTLGVSDSVHQGLLRSIGFLFYFVGSTLHPWDSQGNIGTNTSRTSIGSSVINSVLQNCMNTPLLTDFNNRPSTVLHPHTGPIINALTAPRRPIVKAQQATPISLGSPLSHVGVTNPSDTAGFDGYAQKVCEIIILREVRFHMDRRFFHFPASSHFQVPGEPLNAGDKPQLSNIFHTGGDEFCIPTPCGPHLGQPVNALTSSNNSNSGSIYLPAKLRASRPQSENSFAFFSQLVEMDRSGVSSLGCPKTSSAFNHLLSASMKAKTLEEIEH